MAMLEDVITPVSGQTFYRNKQSEPIITFGPGSSKPSIKPTETKRTQIPLSNSRLKEHIERPPRPVLEEVGLGAVTGKYIRK